MRFNFTSLYIGFFLLSVSSVYGQMVLPTQYGGSKIENKGSAIQHTPCEATIQASTIKDDWNIIMRNFSQYNHTSQIPTKDFITLKSLAEERRVRNSSIQSNKPTSLSGKDGAHLHFNFRGNTRDNSVPMDNSMAVSRNGFIISAINTNVVFANPSGAITFQRSFADFFKVLGLGTRMYDPRVIYDVEQNRFIFMCLHGSDPSATQLCIAFSKTEDPNGEWNYYKIDGNPSGDNNWFDYPNISVSKSDFYIAGLMRNLPGDWQYSVLYQIDKNAGYQGKELSWKYYNELSDADSKPSFNLVPTPSGWSNLIGPGMYFVSNNALGGNTYNLYYTSGALADNPSLFSLQTTGLTTELAPNGRQKNTSNVLNTFDSRIWSALYQDSIIHIGSHVNTANGDVGLFYGRINVKNVSIEADVYTESNMDYGFPSFSTFGDEQSDKVLVNYLVSGPDFFPSQEQRIVTGNGAQFNWMEPTRLINGAAFVNVLQDGEERWGDYTTSGRRFTDGRIETWVTGCFGESGSYGTWLGQYFDSLQYATQTLGDFVADKTTINKDNEITFTDLTDGNATSWMWLFPGATPNSSTSKNPKVLYPSNGAYDVTLIVTSPLGIDTVYKPEYIHIQDPEVKPTVDFLISKDTIYVGESITTQNLSSDNALFYDWTFIFGTPNKSTEKEPTVQYNTAGSYLIALTAKNNAGGNSKIKANAIRVLARTVPDADFTANETTVVKGSIVNYLDKSKGGIDSYEWMFEGGTPSESSLANPIVQYENSGTYTVQLIAKNNLGSDTITRTQYITVTEPSSTIDQLITNYSLYPNPVINDKITLDFVINQRSTISINLYASNGMLIKELYNDVVKSGHNTLSFNPEMLNQGQYYIMVKDSRKSLFSLPFVKL